jgi:cytochrome P450 / NADPH-cytochrome P450 reductase
MVGPGTGVVPYIAFIEERELLKAKGQVLQEAHVYFGCKDKANDFIYRDQLCDALDNKIINSLGLAFSRPADGSPK